MRVIHLAATKKPWLYTLKTGEEVAYPKLGGGMAVHKLHPEKLWLLGLCAELDGRARPFREGDTEHLATRTAKKVTCMECKVAFSLALDAGRVEVSKRGLVSVAVEFEKEKSVDFAALNGWFKRTYSEQAQLAGVSSVLRGIV